MPHALFCNDAKLSKAYPTEADVWKEATRSGLVVDAGSAGKMPAPRPVLDNDYEIRPCPPDPDEDPARNKAEAERQGRAELEVGSVSAGVAGLRRRFGHHRVAFISRRSLGQRRLLGSERHAHLPAVQTPDRAGDLQHLPGRTCGLPQ